MIVIADTSPLNYLIQIDEVGLLRQIYQRIVVAEVVLAELMADGAPSPVRAWCSTLPDWVLVEGRLVPSHIATEGLDRGERQAIHLAMAIDAGLLLLDERKATAVARELGILVTGTLGVLRDAHIAGFVDGVAAFEKLRKQTNFRCAPTLGLSYEASLKLR